jgi:hypothetical protein
VPDPLEFSTTPITSATEGVEYSYDVVCVDPQGDTVVLSVEVADTWGGDFTDHWDGTGTYTFTPSEADGGNTCTVALLCAAGGDEVQQSAVVTVSETNQGPVITNLSTSVTGYFGQPSTFFVTATDADQPANVLSFSLDSTTCGFPVAVSAAGAVSWTCGLPETCAVQVAVADDYSPAATTNATLTIECPIPTTPVIDAAAQTVTFLYADDGSTGVSVYGDFTDPAWSLAVPMTRSGDWWIAQVGPLASGTYRYKLVRWNPGEQWLQDPLNPDSVDDGYGGYNSLFTMP